MSGDRLYSREEVRNMFRYVGNLLRECDRANHIGNNYRGDESCEEVRNIHDTASGIIRDSVRLARLRVERGVPEEIREDGFIAELLEESRQYSQEEFKL